MVVPNERIENDLSQISNLLDNMNLDKLYIFSIIVDDKFNCNIIELEQGSNVIYIEIGIHSFIEGFLNSPHHNFWEHNKKSLYILRDGNYSDINELFSIIQEDKYKLVRGSSQKAHLVSSVDFRLSCYMLILCNLNYGKASYENSSFHYLSKDRYLPSR